jgi:hypothetical protein
LRHENNKETALRQKKRGKANSRYHPKFIFSFHIAKNLHLYKNQYGKTIYHIYNNTLFPFVNTKSKNISFKV